MITVATALLFDRTGKFLIYLRDNKPSIPFPNHWDLFGGHVEEGETPEIALLRELKEELNIDPVSYKFYKAHHVTAGDAQPNTKYIYIVHISEEASQLTLYEGQELRAIDINDWQNYKFANVLGDIVGEYATQCRL